MSSKGHTGVVEVTEAAAQAALRRGSSSELAADEERALRMRLGASLPRSARLERIAVAGEAEIELLAYELEAFLRLRAGGAAGPVPARPVASRTKEKIVRALRRKPQR